MKGLSTMRIDRMLAIIVILLNRRRIKAKELADRFEVSLRTIYRDIEAINIAGIPVISNQGVDGGYEIPENYKLSRQLLSPSDMRSVLSALKGLNTAVEDKELSLIYEKVRSLLPDITAAQVKEGAAYLIFDTMGWDDSGRFAGKIQTLYDAAKSRRPVRISYTDNRGLRSERILEPMTIVQKGVSWYIYGFCRKRNDFRIFKLSRIHGGIALLDETFTRKEKSYRSDSLFRRMHEGLGTTTAILKFDADLKHVIDDHFDQADIIEQTVEHITISLAVPRGDWLLGMILSYGDRVEVISPFPLRDRIRTTIRNMMKKYKK